MHLENVQLSRGVGRGGQGGEQREETPRASRDKGKKGSATSCRKHHGQGEGGGGRHSQKTQLNLIFSWYRLEVAQELSKVRSAIILTLLDSCSKAKKEKPGSTVRVEQFTFAQNRKPAVQKGNPVLPKLRDQRYIYAFLNAKRFVTDTFVNGLLEGRARRNCDTL